MITKFICKPLPLALAGLFAFLLPQVAYAQSVSSTNLVFGAFVAGSTSGTVVVSDTGSRSATGGVTLLTAAQFPSPAAAVFTITNASKNTFTLTYPTSATLTRTGGTETMTVNTFTSNVAAGSQGANGKGWGNLTGLTNNGSFNMGATLQVGANQVSGSYSGTFTVTIAYP